MPGLGHKSYLQVGVESVYGTGVASGAKLEIIADCGHLSSMEQPEAVNRALRTWLGA